MATLTGAQLIATGKMHAGILANTAELERRAVEGGLVSGDLCFPLLYAPELLKKVRTENSTINALIICH
jgi:probable aminopeptidase NPEPL1